MSVLYIQAFALLFCFVVGFLIAIPVGLNRSNHDGHCMLYAHIHKIGNRVKSRESNGGMLNPGSRLTCDFCIFSGCVSLLVAFVLLLATVYTILQNGFRSFNLARYIGDSKRSKKRNKPLIGAWIQFCFAAVMSLLTFVTACLISSGFREFCEKGLKKIHKELDSCSMLEDYIGSFYKELSISQIGAWLGALFWIVITITGRMNVRNMRPKRFQLNDNDNDYQQIESPVHL